MRLWQHAKEHGLDVVFGHYEEKQHSAWRNFGSWFTNRMTDWALDKPHGFYLSSFRCVSAFLGHRRGGIAMLSAMFSRAYWDDLRRAHKEGVFPTVDDPARTA